MRSSSTIFTLLVVLLAPARDSAAQLTPDDALAGMTRGINLGNTLEPPTEGAWNNGPAQEFYFDDFKSAGFTSVRIPVRWDEHTGAIAPYTVSSDWMDRVEEVVDWGLDRGFIVVLNAHHEEWLKADYANPINQARFDSIWTQVAFRFKDKSDSLLFEIINEPFGMSRTQVDDLNSRIIPIIRKTNPTRIVVYSGADYAGATWLLSAAIPDDDFIMGYYHSYDPWEFCGLGNGTWGSVSNRNDVRNRFTSVATFSNLNDVPVMLSEFGAIRETDFNSRMQLYAFYVEQALEKHIAFHVWDDGGDFGLYDRSTRTWSVEKDILIHTQVDGPTSLVGVVVDDSLVSLSWQNRSVAYSGIRVERQVLDGTFEEIRTLPPDATVFVDSTVSQKETYLYRVIGIEPTGDDAWSYPIKIYLPPTQRAAFNGTPSPVPGSVEAEDYDIGGEGLTYHDTESENIPGEYRVEEGVDIEARTSGGFQVAYVETNEWLEYTIDVAEAGTYAVKVSVASLDGGGRFRLLVGSNASSSVTVPSTGDWQTLTEVSTQISLDAGEQILRFYILFAGPFNIDKLVFEKMGSTGVEVGEAAATFEIYPNPATETLQIDLATINARTMLTVTNLVGRTVLSQQLESASTGLSIGSLAAGIYFVRVTDESGELATGSFVKR